MRQFAKSILIAAGACLLAYTLAVLGLNIYLQSEKLQKRIRGMAESAAGGPVMIRSTHYTPWSGFSVTGITVPGKVMPGRPPFLEASSVSFRFELLALLQGRLAISEVVIASPSLVSFPPVEKKPEQEIPAPPSPQPESSPGKPAGTGAAVVEITPPPPPHASAPAMVEVRRFLVTDGSTQFYDSNGALAFSMTGVGITGEILPDRSVKGAFRVAGTGLGLLVHPRHVKGTFTWQGGRLVVPDLQADWAGGKLTGRLEVDPAGDFSIELAAADVQIKKLAADAGINGEGARGQFFLQGNLKGTGGKPDSFTGQVEVSLQQARFQPLDFIRQIGELLNIRELQMLELKTAGAVFTIRDRKVTTDSLVMESENLVMDARGPVGFDGKMKLQARLLLNERLRKDLAGLLGDNFKDSEREGYQQLPFTVTGTVSRPKTDLLDKLTGFRIGQDVGGLLKNLFRAAPEKKKSDTPAAKEPGGG